MTSKAIATRPFVASVLVLLVCLGLGEGSASSEPRRTLRATRESSLMLLMLRRVVVLRACVAWHPLVSRCMHMR